jgi:uncharacterized protein YbaA (DUF1428 family)
VPLFKSRTIPDSAPALTNKTPSKKLRLFAGCVAAIFFVVASGRTQVTPTWPAARYHFSAAYDESLKQWVIYGGYIWNLKTQKVQVTSDVWGWNGSSWKLMADSGLRKYVAPLAFDSKRQRLLMFAGANDSDAIDGKLSSFDGETWKPIKDLPSLQRADASMVYDSKRDRLVLFGGREAMVVLADTWEFDGNDWKPTFMPGPSLRSSAAMAYDAARGVTVLYGGFRPLAALGDTWEWDGAQWKQVSDSGPGPRAWPAIAYDSKRKRTLLFGGEDEKGHFFSDTWAWDGKTWTRLATEGPPERIQSAMGYDAARDRVVLFGGVCDKPQQILGDVWEFDGTKWEQKLPNPH